MKIKCFCSVLFLALFQTVFAKQASHKNLSQTVEELSERVVGVTTETEFGTPSITTATAWPNVEGHAGYLSCAVFMWKTKIGGTSFATTNNLFSVVEPIQGYVKDNPMGWDWGLKLGAGKKFKYDAWALDGEFTYFKNAAGATLQGSPQTAVIPLKGPFAEATQRATSSVRFTFFNLDLRLSRHYFISHALALTSFLGVKNTWDTFKQKVMYFQGPSLLKNYASTQDRNKMWGIGPQAGMNTQWHLGRGFHLNNFLSASLLYSYFQVREHSYITPSDGFDVALSQKYHQFVPTMQCNLSMGWSRFLNEKKNYLSFDLSYESQYYWHMNQAFSLYEFKETLRMQNSGADIAMYGVSFKVKVFF